MSLFCPRTGLLLMGLSSSNWPRQPYFSVCSSPSTVFSFILLHSTAPFPAWSSLSLLVWLSSGLASVLSFYESSLQSGPALKDHFIVFSFRELWLPLIFFICKIWLMLKLQLQYFGHLMWRADSLEKTLMLAKTEVKRRRGWQRMRWLDSITD